MAERRAVKGPWLHRFLIVFFTILLGVLIYWLLSFVLRDIGNWPPPSYTDLEQEMLEPELPNELAKVRSEIGETERQIRAEQARQAILSDSTNSSQQTMNQLLEIQRLSLEKGVSPSAEEQHALADSERIFLGNQQEYQRLNQEITKLNEHLEASRQKEIKLNDELEVARQPIRQKYQQLLERHNLRVAAMKLGVLLPLLALAVFLFLRLRGTLYSPIVYAYGAALLLKTAMVMHEYFPSRYFKYLLILAALAGVLRTLIYLLRVVASPGRAWLLKQYREAYERFFCPICEYPIRRAAFRNKFWTRGSLKRQPFPPDAVAGIDEPYCCPVCATRLFEECTNCHGIRHSLLPACEKCGLERPLPLLTSESTTSEESQSI